MHRHKHSHRGTRRWEVKLELPDEYGRDEKEIEELDLQDSLGQHFNPLVL